MRLLSVRAKFILVLLIATIFGCSTPTERFERISNAAGFEIMTVHGDPFEHLILVANTDDIAYDDLHVYIEGDGSPWIANSWVAADPTPRAPVMLQLMKLDPGPVLYLGRPCYFELQQHCEQKDWTHGRYSEAVLNSMVVALETVLRQLRVKGDIVMIGHSGGGVLAMLLAPRIQNVEMVVTLAANLDIDRWTEYHNFSPLFTSINPATEAVLPGHITQYHLVGESDSNVPVKLVQSAVDREPDAALLRYPGYDHNCCWAEIWPTILNRM